MERRGRNAKVVEEEELEPVDFHSHMHFDKSLVVLVKVSSISPA